VLGKGPHFKNTQVTPRRVLFAGKGESTSPSLAAVHAEGHNFLVPAAALYARGLFFFPKLNENEQVEGS
jgi:hypothetical protein